MKVKSKIKRLRTVCAVHLLTVLLGLIVMGPVSAKEQTDKNHQKLIGPVKTLIEEQGGSDGRNQLIVIRLFDEIGNEIQVISGGKHDNAAAGAIITMPRYDHNGNKSSELTYGIDGAPNSRKSYMYDDKGNKTIEFSNTLRDPFFFQLLYTKYDDTGRKVEDFYYGPGFQHALYSYDQQKQMAITWLHLGAPISVEQYDSEGRLQEIFTYRGDRSLDSKSVYSYDERGNVVQIRTVSENGTVRAKVDYVYEYDAFGNWTMQRWSSLRNDGKPREDIGIRTRQFTYYP